MIETANPPAEVATEPPAEISETNITAPEYIDPLLDDSELFSLVSENANVLVTPSWLGVEIPLAAAMFHIIITRENVHLITAEVRRLLANRPVENEEPEEPSEENQGEDDPEPEEDEPEQNSEPVESKKEIQKKIIKSEIGKDQKKTDETIPEIQERAEPKDAKISKPPAGETQKKGAVTKSSTVETKAVAEAELLQNESQKPLPSEIKSTPAAGPNGSIDKTISDNSHTPKAPITAEAGLNQPAHKSAQVVELDQRMPAKPSQAEVKTDSVAEVLPTPDEAQPLTKQTSEPAAENTNFKSAIEPDHIELVPVNNELMTNSRDMDTELAAEKIESSEVDLIPSGFEYPEDSPIVFSEDQLILLEHSEEADMAEGYDHVAAHVPAEDGPNNLFIGKELLASHPAVEEIPEKAEAVPNYEHAAQSDLSIESMETALQQLSEFIKTSEPEITERTNQILDKIGEVPVKEDKKSEAETREELEELFSELFETVNMDYTSELIDSLVLITLERRLLKEIEETKDKKQVDQTPPEPGTHEIIKKLLAGLSSIKKAITHAYVIGRSALLLYRFSFAGEVPVPS